MTTKLYTEEHISVLLGNSYVTKCSPKHLTLTDTCKQEAIRIREMEGLSPKNIFRRFSFPDFIIDSSFPKETMKRWGKMVKKGGVSSLTGKQKGRKKKERDMESKTPEEQILYLQAKVAYLEYENDFLRLLRAGKN